MKPENPPIYNVLRKGLENNPFTKVLSNMPVRGALASVRSSVTAVLLSRAIRDPAEELGSWITMDMKGSSNKRIQVTEPTEKNPLN